MNRPAQQDWVLKTSIMQQSVLFAAVRAPDGIRKDHPIKVIMRWYRRCVLISAFDGQPIDNPFSAGGGSFTGPFTADHAEQMRLKGLEEFDGVREVYLRHVDELPHHFQLHLMHAAQIVGFRHQIAWIRDWWLEFYLMIVNDMHLFPETEEQMDLRLCDNEFEWRRREAVVAL